MIFENVKEVVIKAVNGKVEIEGWKDKRVEVNYTLHGDVDVKVEQRGSRLIVKEEPKKKLMNLFKSGWAEIHVKVPRNVIVNAKNVNGGLKARGTRFEEATTVNGEITLEECEVKKLSTVNGEIRAHLTVAGPLRASTVNGDIEITIEELEGDVEASCVNGDMTLRPTDFCDARIVAKAVHGDVELVGINPENPVIGTGDYEVKVSTVNGDVTVELV
ncbi:DUF4097 family beta strand repeat-containing protein [Thermococcus stetteri]|uniref:DUF4097 family beta strand repeat-containing protein n=1 Tax=Thermococcus stetteri TaxID=49900 RepID=UPI001AE7DC7C|nr:DUF4097 family beta strand repeat-containing protein [Thermococcus stetteri]MBP1913039.1 DUF4097 and DUF4098 domain-containing protein YvlB [Thermococcus stetteri]